MPARDRHRDLKPHNVILGPSGVTLVGIASLDNEGTTALTRQGTFLGSLAWMPPELIQGGSAAEASDTFALALVLGFMALGRLHEEPDLDGCDPSLTSVIEAALDKYSGAASVRTANPPAGSRAAWNSAPPGGADQPGTPGVPALAGGAGRHDLQEYRRLQEQRDRPPQKLAA